MTGINETDAERTNREGSGGQDRRIEYCRMGGNNGIYPPPKKKR